MSIAISFSAQAWDGNPIGKLARLDAAAGAAGSMDLRIAFEGVTSLCTASDATFAYINSTDPNYKVIAGLLMMAYTNKTTIRVYTTNSANVGCVIGYVGLGE